ncbi:MAG: hypothetical protein ACXWUR_08125 [Allosphingosinicella sp.]
MRVDPTFRRRRFLATLLGCAGAVAVAVAVPACAATEPAFRPENYGATGDGRTDDTAAFHALNRAVAAAGGGLVELRAGAVYRVGRQVAWPDRLLTVPPVLHARGVSRFVVDLNGATLKYNDGLKFGAFDRRTGGRLTHRAPFLDLRAAADLGHAILAEDVAYFEVRNGHIDLNSAGAVVGGEWGDTGWQLPHYGVAAYNCDEVAWTNVHVRNSCLDGYLYTHRVTARSRPFPFVMRGCSAERVGRNGISITGGNSVLVEGCRFERAGEAPRGGGAAPIGSQPRSCFDIEAEGTLCRNITIRDCDLIGGPQTSTAFVADSGDSADILIENSRLVGTVWTTKPRTVIRNCRINGLFGRVLGGQRDPRDNTLISGCRVSDVRWAGDAPPGMAVLSGEGAGSKTESPLVVRDCVFDVHFHAVNLRWTRLEGVTINLFAGTRTLPDGAYMMFLAGAIVRGLRIVDRIPAAQAPRVPYYVHEALFADIRAAEIVSPAGRILWNTSSVAAGGYAGPFRPNSS